MYVNISESDIQFLPGVGPKRALLLRNELNINTFGDLVRLYPFRYVDRGSIRKISDIQYESSFVQIQAEVESVKREPKRLSVTVSDGSGELELVFFRGIKYITDELKPGSTFLFFGKPTVFNGRMNIVHPEIDSPRSGQDHGQGEKVMVTGIYQSSEKLKNAGITAKVMNKMMESALKRVLPEIRETLPSYVIKEKGLVPLRYALENIHFPKDEISLAKASYRLKFEELFLLQLSLLKQKYIRSRNSVGIMMKKVGTDFNACYNSLPYTLTGAQKRVIKEIRKDLTSGHQMNRLLQGDVGSGKTMVAVLSSLIAVGNGYQAAIMAPTEVLAKQHFRNISDYLKPTKAKTAILTGSSTAAERRKISEDLQNGDIDIIIGTHALIEDNVIFKNIGLAVIDEQHRFGVDQRARLWEKSKGGIAPHILVMTATPIPRTLAMTLYGDLDVSAIDEMPPGRKPVETIQAGEKQRDAMYGFLKRQIALGRQVFIVYPLIFESEKTDYQNLEKGYEDVVRAFPFPPYKIAIVHGQQNNKDKEFNMDAFVAGRANILVSTTVIEVGVDVPNASVMVIESAERFGLSQLHQLRGRVGRGSDKSYCVLMKGQKIGNESQKRIDMMCRTENGFELAEEDLKMRGPGDLEGTQQSGLPITLDIASLAKDGNILNDARAYAQSVLDKDPDLSSEEDRPLAAELRKNKYKLGGKDYSKIS
ncbi:MAG: ATP-dependent DNA helicase RecG [Bacteroidales bacterium]|jgi:ATP-dependent DNA helicase RecG|nr:ATP-dependent DNA helicase RecG [Bacteroidales bacterium]